MSTPINDGGPAFPNNDSALLNGERAVYARDGMTLRDYFAAKALPTIISCFFTYAEGQACKPGNGSVNDVWARIAYATADAMLSERNKKP